MKSAFVGMAPLAIAIGTICCQRSPEESQFASKRTSPSSAARKRLAIPKPIPGGDFFPDLPHHRAGIIHQFYPGPGDGFDGLWAEPNEITDFNGTVAQVFMGGKAVDNSGKEYIVDVDNRVYQGEFIGTKGERAYGTFCEI